MESTDFEKGIKINKKIACEIGLNESIIVGYLKKRNFTLKENIVHDLSFVSEQTIERALAKLKSAGYIKTGISPIERKNILTQKDCSNVGIGDFICEWCGIHTFVLHSHHYPIQKKDNGTKTVNICPNCHQEYHSMDNVILLTNEVIENETL